MKNRNLFSLGLIALILSNGSVFAQSNDYHRTNDETKNQKNVLSKKAFSNSEKAKFVNVSNTDEVMFLQSNDCSAVETFNFDFENMGAHELFGTYCWNANYTNYPTVFITVNPTEAEGPNPNYVLQIYKSNENAILFVFPEVSTKEGTHFLSFDIKMALNGSPNSITGNEKIQIGTMSNKNNFNSFLPYGEDFAMNATGTFSTEPITFPQGHKYVAMKLDFDSEPHKVLLLDNIKWTSQNSLGTNETSVNKNGVYPNPVSSTLYIDSKLEVQSAQIFDLNGKLVKVSDEKSIPVQDLMNGVYILKMNFKNGTSETQKFIKK